MKKLGAVAPEFVAEVGAALSSVGRVELVPQLASGGIERCTYDSSAKAGYIYLRESGDFAETIPFLESGFNVDVDHKGRILGIEFLSRSDVFGKLRNANAL